MTIHVEKVGAGYVVSDGGCWVEGAYASEEAARMAVSLTPEALTELWRNALARDPDALLSVSDLQGAM